MQVDNLARGRNQPFYKIIVDARERNGRQLSYVAEENIDAEAEPVTGGVVHSELGRYFCRRAAHPVVRNQVRTAHQPPCATMCWPPPPPHP